jgi:hypothetical protein
VSHSKEREEKICLNCSSFIYGRYCHKCGQENIEPKESFWHLLTHFVYDVTHFDGKFFSTGKYLLSKPGFLSKEYMKGRRMSYLNPIRMYVFTSAIFFIFFFSIIKPEEKIKITDKSKKELTASAIKERLQEDKVETIQALRKDFLPEASKQVLLAQLTNINEDLQRLQKDTTHLEQLNTFKINSKSFTKYNSFKEYDSVQQALPLGKKDNWFVRKVRMQQISIKQKYGENTTEFLNELSHKFLHSIPQLLFVSLPLVALILMLLYIRRKNFYYVDHVIFLVHVYCAMFIFLFFRLSFSALATTPYLHWIRYINIGIILYMFFYVYKSMRNFYQQRRGKTVLKFSLLMLMTSVVMSVLFMIYLIMSVFTV